ncbi:hypothetical protein VTN77DRAFT_8927 [Rasamsonia byssochlamydoides]|uniref:uncharacterized protein n=1 Tax=Rasamsonia byssochlamydoides TaxID=89139 RepID=UPI0037424F7B
MAPIVHCVRHGQAEHNKGGDAYLIRDPHLTEAGVAECRALETRFPFQSSIDLIVSSPLRRALETSLCSFQPAIARGVKILALPELQETSDIACDTGSEISDLERDFADKKGPSGPVIDLSLMDKDWNSKIGRWAPSSNALLARARAARRWLKARPEKEIVVVSHGGFLHYLTNDWTGIKAAEHASAWENCEFRTYEFSTDDPDGDAAMIETEQSRVARGEDAGRIPSKEEQELLYLKTMQMWEDRGFQNPLKLNEKFESKEQAANEG